NYAGLPGIGGFDLGMKFREHADKLGAEFAEDVVLRIEDADAAELDLVQAAEAGSGLKKVIGENETYYAKTVIIATGAQHRKLGVPGEEELVGMGVSYCATCDGAFFKNKVTAVVGGGDVAIEDAIFLGRICEKVYLIHRRDELRGAKSLQKKLMEMGNVEILWDTVVDSINGKFKVSTLSLSNKKTGEQKEIAVDGVFIAVGISPNTEEFKGTVEMDNGGYIVAGEDGTTSVPGVFAAGDVRTKQLRQIITAVADGANCVTSVERYLNEQ
ncbi:MAG: FAD-dependent oxidoreductase, partial [Lachnospiraceae bacterium]|nr:FAD-dependent oxidoreductase [Lachnospiraceae bacterium]